MFSKERARNGLLLSPYLKKYGRCRLRGKQNAATYWMWMGPKRRLHLLTLIKVDLKIKFEYEGQKRVILLPQPVKYRRLIDKLHQLCGSLFTVEYSAAEGEFIREIECQDDLDDVIDLIRNKERVITCLPLKLVPCASSYLSQQSTTGASKPAVTWSSSAMTKTPQQFSGGFFQDESSDQFPESGFKPCRYSPSLGMDSSLLRCTAIPNYSGKLEKRVDYIPEFNQDQTNKHPSVFIPDSMDFHTSYNYNAKTKASERQVSQRSLESNCSASSGSASCLVRSKSDSQGIEGGVSTFLPSLKNMDYNKTLSMSWPTIIATSEKTLLLALPAEHECKSPCLCTPVTGSHQVPLFHPSVSKTFQTQLTNPSMKKTFKTHLENECDGVFSSSFTPGNWVKGKLLGRGAFGQVFTGYDIDRGVEFAVKQVQIYSQSNEVLEQIEALEMEISILQGIHHDHIVEYYGMLREPECLSIFIEFIPMGSLRDHISRYGMLTEKVTGRYTSQVLTGLAYLHSKMIVHRDIKCANILRDHHGNLKLGDFGAAKLLQSQSVAEMSKIAGTPYFMAPEVIRGEACGCRSDIWSLGCTVVEMLTKNPPWYKYDSIAAIYKIGNAWPPEYELPGTASDCVKDFLSLCFAASASNRPKAEELLFHAFIHQNNMLS